MLKLYEDYDEEKHGKPIKLALEDYDPEKHGEILPKDKPKVPMGTTSGWHLSDDGKYYVRFDKDGNVDVTPND